MARPTLQQLQEWQARANEFRQFIDAFQQQVTTSEGSGSGRENQQTFDLLGLPTEVISMIFKELGDLPEGLQTQVSAIHKVHPGYAICSTSKFLRDWFVAAMGPLPKLELVLKPGDYTVTIPPQHPTLQTPRSLLDRRLKLLGFAGIEHIDRIWITGPGISRTTTDLHVNRFLNDQNRSITQFAPAERAFVKLHVEQDVSRKQDILSTLFKNLLDVFGTRTIETISIYTGEMPASVWREVVIPYVSSQKNLQNFHFTDEINTQNYRRGTRGPHNLFFGYLPRLFVTTWFPDRDGQPDNYPDSLMRHKRNFETLHGVVTEFLRAKRRLEEVVINNE